MGEDTELYLRHIELKRPGGWPDGGGKQAFGYRFGKLRREVLARDIC